MRLNQRQRWIWTDERVTLIKELAAKKLSSEQIAAHFRMNGLPKMTASGIIGASHKYKAPLETRLVRNTYPRKAILQTASRVVPIGIVHQKRPELETKRAHLGPEPEPLLRNGKRITLFERDDKKDCPSTYEHEGKTYYCGHPKVGDYCAYHQALLHTALPLRRRV